MGKARLSLSRAVALLASGHYQNGRRVLILAADPAQAGELDQALWTFDQGSFVPHAVAGEQDQEQEPVLIALEPRNLNQAAVLIMAHPLDDPPLAKFSHFIQFVPADNGPELEASRKRYRKLSGNELVELVHTTSLF